MAGLMALRGDELAIGRGLIAASSPAGLPDHYGPIGDEFALMSVYHKGPNADVTTEGHEHNLCIVCGNACDFLDRLTCAQCGGIFHASEDCVGGEGLHGAYVCFFCMPHELPDDGRSRVGAEVMAIRRNRQLKGETDKLKGCKWSPAPKKTQSPPRGDQRADEKGCHLAKGPVPVLDRLSPAEVVQLERDFEFWGGVGQLYRHKAEPGGSSLSPYEDAYERTDSVEPAQMPTEIPEWTGFKWTPSADGNDASSNNRPRSSFNVAEYEGIRSKRKFKKTPPSAKSQPRSRPWREASAPLKRNSYEIPKYAKEKRPSPSRDRTRTPVAKTDEPALFDDVWRGESTSSEDGGAIPPEPLPKPEIDLTIGPYDDDPELVAPSPYMDRVKRRSLTPASVGKAKEVPCGGCFVLGRGDEDMLRCTQCHQYWHPPCAGEHSLSPQRKRRQVAQWTCPTCVSAALQLQGASPPMAQHYGSSRSQDSGGVRIRLLFEHAEHVVEIALPPRWSELDQKIHDTFGLRHDTYTFKMENDGAARHVDRSHSLEDILRELPEDGAHVHTLEIVHDGRSAEEAPLRVEAFFKSSAATFFLDPADDHRQLKAHIGSSFRLHDHVFLIKYRHHDGSWHNAITSDEIDEAVNHARKRQRVRRKKTATTSLALRIVCDGRTRRSWRPAGYGRPADDNSEAPDMPVWLRVLRAGQKKEEPSGPAPRNGSKLFQRS